MAIDRETASENLKRTDRVADRFWKFAIAKAQFATDFESSVGLGVSYISKQRRENNGSISSEAIKMTLAKYPNLNIYWLMTGEGDMELSGSLLEKVKGGFERATERATELANQKTIPAGQSDAFIKLLQDYIALLVESNRDKDVIIRMLEEQKPGRKQMKP